jgi:hypothetical protein
VRHQNGSAIRRAVARLPALRTEPVVELGDLFLMCRHLRSQA